MDARTKTHLKAVLAEAKRMSEELAADGPEHAKLFASGMLTGLSIAAQIAAGTSADAAMEQVVTNLEAAIGRAYMNGAAAKEV